MKKLLIILLLPLSAFSQSRESLIDSSVVIMHELLNEYRIENRLDTLELSDDLTKKAQKHAEWMYHNSYMHSLTCKEEKLAENIVNGHDWILEWFPVEEWVDGTLTCWKESPRHNANLLEYRITKAGYGFYKGYSVQMFK